MKNFTEIERRRKSKVNENLRKTDEKRMSTEFYVAIDQNRMSKKTNGKTAKIGRRRTSTKTSTKLEGLQNWIKTSTDENRRNTGENRTSTKIDEKIKSRTNVAEN